MRLPLPFVLAVTLLLGAASCTPAPALADTRVGVHVGSHHFGGDFNNVNPGVYVYHNGWTAGTYYNSERKQSAYAGYTFEHALGRGLTAALTVGAITGYEYAKVLPLIFPSVSYKLSDTYSVRVGALPKVGKAGAAAVHLMIESKF